MDADVIEYNFSAKRPDLRPATVTAFWLATDDTGLNNEVESLIRLFVLHFKFM